MSGKPRRTTYEEINDLIRERDQLREKCALVMTENEALKKLECPSCGRNSGGQELRIFKNLTTALETARVELKRYTSWQPSDPGTKEAMEIARFVEAGNTDYTSGGQKAIKALAHALTAAMVRLEEAEKEAR